MQAGSSFIHLIMYTTMVKTKFKIDTIWVRLIILKFVYYAIWCDRWCGGSEFVCWCDICWLGDDVDMLHVKRMTSSGFYLYSYNWLQSYYP
jgi:hypothetical protein